MEAEWTTMRPSLRASYLNDETGCRLCPRMCGVNRSVETGVCGRGREIQISRSALHFWEEPVISGRQGSGAVFFAGCNLGCVFCQNYEISRRSIDRGKYSAVNICKLADLFLDLQDQGAANINLVTGTAYTLEIIDALHLAKKSGLTIPVVYNTSGYENVETLKALEEYVDVYLPDFKYITNERALKYSFAEDYPERAMAAIDEMVRQKGSPSFEDTSSGKIIKQGVIVRHMVMPLATKESMKILSYLYDRYGDKIYISIMSQYTPISANLGNYPEINRRVTKREYEKVVDYAISLGIKNAFTQELDVSRESFIPEFAGIEGY